MALYGKLTMPLYDAVAVACTSIQLNDTTVCNSATQLNAVVLCSCMKLDYSGPIKNLDRRKLRPDRRSK